MTAEGKGSLLDLSSVTSIDAGFSATGSTLDSNHQLISALDGGVIDLSGVQTITGPVHWQNDIRFVVDSCTVEPCNGVASTLDMSALTTITNTGNGGYRFTARSSGSVLNMSSLATITSAGSGRVYVDIANGGHVQMGDVNNTSVTTTIDLNTDSLFSVGSLQADSPLAITLNTATDRLEATGSLRLRNKISIKAPAGGTIRLGGDLLYSHTEPDDLSLGLVQLECVGDWQWLEVGGTDFDLEWDFLPDDNFGFQQLIVGAPERASVVGLIDIHDNLQPGVADALYLFGGLRCTDTGTPCLSNANCPEESTCEEVDNGTGSLEGLRMLGGSTLVIGYLNVFALLDLDEDGVMERTRLHDLFEPGETRYRFNHNGNDGWIIRPEIYPPIDARQPSNPDGSNVAGWTEIDVVLLGDPPPLPGTDEFEIQVTGGTEPTIVGAHVGSYKVTVELDRPIPVGQRTKITHVPSGSKTCVGYLPGDVDANGSSTAQDILKIIDCLNGVAECGIWQCDVDRSGICGASDILRVIDLLNGADQYDVWLGATVAECP